jgi:hypothetical protein
VNQGIQYTQFYDWFRRTRQQVVPVQVDGMPSESETNAEPESNKAPEPKKEKKMSVREEHDVCIASRSLSSHVTVFKSVSQT